LSSFISCPSKALQIIRCQGTWSNHRHVAPQHVDKLWDLVNASLAQPAANLGDVLTVAHCSELWNDEGAGTAANSNLVEQHRPSIFPSGQQGSDSKNRRKDRKSPF
jgi:hypothetical protein